MPKIKLVKTKTNEMSGTGGSASATSGTGAQYAAPKAFPRVAKDYNKTFGTHFAPSIPNRPSKAITYKELWEDFKVGDKVTYLGHPGEITAVNKEMTGAITYNVAYDKGTGRTKATNIYNKGGEIKPLKEADTYDSLRGILKQLGAEEDSIKVLLKAVEMGALKPSEAVDIIKKTVKRESTDDADYDSDTTGGEGLQTQNPLPVKEGTWKLGSPDDIRNFIKIVNQIKDKFYNVVGDDEVFDGLDRAASRAEELIQLKNMDNPLIREARYSEFKKMTQVRTPGEQLHRAIREIRRKIDEINKLVSYTEKMKTEMKSDVSEVNYLKRTKEALAKISARIQETSNKIKRLVQ
jgi:hypothetical protein